MASRDVDAALQRFLRARPLHEFDFVGIDPNAVYFVPRRGSPNEQYEIFAADSIPFDGSPNERIKALYGAVRDHIARLNVPFFQYDETYLVRMSNDDDVFVTKGDGTHMRVYSRGTLLSFCDLGTPERLRAQIEKNEAFAAVLREEIKRRAQDIEAMESAWCAAQAQLKQDEEPRLVTEVVPASEVVPNEVVPNEVVQNEVVPNEVVPVSDPHDGRTADR